MLTTAVSNNLEESRQINFRLWAGGHFTLRKPLCAYGLIAQPVQLSALPGRAPTNRPSPPGRGSFYFGPPQLAASFMCAQHGHRLGGGSPPASWS